jgi:hypothetical protein
MLTLLSASLAQIPAAERARLASWLARFPGLERRRRAHRDSVEAAMSSSTAWARGPDSSAEAVRRHLVWTMEFLAEMGGQRHPIEDRTSALWDPRDRCRLVVTAHCGNWIVGARALAQNLGPIHTIAGVQLQRRWQSRIRAHLSAHGVELSELSGLRQALEREGVVVLHLDGQSGEHRRRSIPVGVRSAALLAAESGASVYSAICRRSAPGRFVLEGTRLSIAGPASGCVGATGGTRPPELGIRARIDAWESTFLEVLQEWILRDPADWLLFSSEHLGQGKASNEQSSVRMREA